MSNALIIETYGYEDRPIILVEDYSRRALSRHVKAIGGELIRAYRTNNECPWVGVVYIRKVY